MKRSILLCTVCTVFALFFISCNFSIPKKIKITGNPGVYLPLGEKDFLITDYVTTEEITKLIGDQIEGLNVYDFHDSADDDKVQKYLIHYPLADFNLDMGEVLKDFNLEDRISESINQSIDIPEVDFSQDETISVSLADLFSAVEEQASFTSTPLPLVAPGPYGGSLPQATFSLTTDVFTSAVFDTGNITLEFSVDQDISDDLVIHISNIKLTDASGSELSAANDDITIDSGAGSDSVVLSLADVEWPDIVKISASGDLLGGTLGQSAGNLVIEGRLSDVTLSSVEGVKLPNPIVLPVNSTVPLGSLPSFFQSAEIGEGTFSLSVGLDTSFGVSTNGLDEVIDLSLQQAGGLNLVSIAEGDTPLNGQKLSRNDLAVNGSVTITTDADGASITGISGGSIDYALSIGTVVSLFSEVVVNTAELPAETLAALSQSITVDLPDDLGEWVEQIQFSEIGIKMDFTELIVGGIGLAVTCDAFGIDDSHTLTEGTITFSNTDFTFFPSGSGQSITFDVTIDLPSEIILSEVTPGSVPAVVGEAELIAEWTEIEVNPTEGISGSFPEEGAAPVDLSIITDYLDDSINLDSFLLHVYLNGPERFDNELSMLLEASYTGSSGSSEPEELVMASPPNFSGVGEDKIFTGPLPDPSFERNITEILKDRPSDLRLAYDVTANNSITLYPYDLDAEHSFKLDIVLELPLALSVEPDEGKEYAVLTFDGMLSDGSSDLFSRDPDTDNSDTDDLLKYLESMTLSIDNTNGIIDSDPGGNLDGLRLYLRAYEEGSQEPYFDRELFSLKPGNQTVKLDKSAIETIMNHVPFSPKLEMEIPGGKYLIKRQGTFGTKISVTAVSTIDEEIVFGGGN